MPQISPARTEDQLGAVGRMLEEYARLVDVQICGENIAREITELPGHYGPPHGTLLVAMDGAEPAGCVALRRLQDRVCEMKRLYVYPRFQGRGIGRALALQILEQARLMGYATMRLDTLESMTAARRLYRSLGFYEIGPYNQHPPECTHFMECRL